MEANESSSTISLLSLPNELLRDIFASLESFADASALACSCRRFGDVWNDPATAAPICDSIAQKSIKCYAQARILLDVQHRRIALHKAQKPETPLHPSLNAFKTGKGLFTNHRLVHTMARLYDAEVSYEVPILKMNQRLNHPGIMLPSERERFLRLAYLLWATFLEDSSVARANIFNCITMIDAYRVADLAHWACHLYGRFDIFGIETSLPMSNWNKGGHYDQLYESCLEKGLRLSKGRDPWLSMARPPINDVDGAPKRSYAIFDYLQFNLDGVLDIP